jgi:hypothetical protein
MWRKKKVLMSLPFKLGEFNETIWLHIAYFYLNELTI